MEIPKQKNQWDNLPTVKDYVSQDSGKRHWSRESVTDEASTVNSETGVHRRV